MSLKSSQHACSTCMYLAYIMYMYVSSIYYVHVCISQCVIYIAINVES